MCKGSENLYPRCVCLFRAHVPLRVHPPIARFLIQRSSCQVQTFAIFNCKKQKPDKTARKHGLGSYPDLATFSLLYPFSVRQFCRYEIPAESSSEFLFTQLNSGEFACVLYSMLDNLAAWWLYLICPLHLLRIFVLMKIGAFGFKLWILFQGSLD